MSLYKESQGIIRLCPRLPVYIGWNSQTCAPFYPASPMDIDGPEYKETFNDGLNGPRINTGNIMCYPNFLLPKKMYDGTGGVMDYRNAYTNLTGRWNGWMYDGLITNPTILRRPRANSSSANSTNTDPLSLDTSDDADSVDSDTPELPIGIFARACRGLPPAFTYTGIFSRASSDQPASTPSTGIFSRANSSQSAPTPTTGIFAHISSGQPASTTPTTGIFPSSSDQPASTPTTGIFNHPHMSDYIKSMEAERDRMTAYNTPRTNIFAHSSIFGNSSGG